MKINDIIEADEADMKLIAKEVLCLACAHAPSETKCEKNDCICDTCPHDCVCKNCKKNNKFVWRGVQIGGQNNAV